MGKKHLTHRRHVKLNGTHQLGKRDRGTYYTAGLGACGKTNVPSDFIIALDPVQYGGGENCFKMVTITFEGRSAQAQVTDLCPSCPDRGIDMTTRLFRALSGGSLEAGVLDVEWHFNDQEPQQQPSPSPSPPPPKHSPKPTSEAPPPPPPPPPTQSTEAKQSSSSAPVKVTKTSISVSASSTKLASTQTNISSSSAPSSTASQTAVNFPPGAAPPLPTPNNLADLPALIVGLGNLVLAQHQG